MLEQRLVYYFKAVHSMLLSYQCLFLLYISNAEIWTATEANTLYRQKLEQLRNLYMGQLSRLSNLLQERKRQFLLEWQAVGGSKDKGGIPY